MVWNADVQPGRAPDVWAMGGQVVISEVDGVTAFDAAGARSWTVPLDDPACTESGGELTCVYGEGAEAAIATLTTEGEISADRPFPGADVAHAIDDDLIVGGTASPDGLLWLGRYPADDRDGPLWQVDLEYPVDTGRWQGMTLSQGVATAFSGTDPHGWVSTAIAADAETGVQRHAVVRTAGGTSGFGGGDEVDERFQPMILPMTGPELTVPGYPDAVIAGSEIYTAAGGEPLLEMHGQPLATLGEDLIATIVDPNRWTPERPITRVERIEVRTGDPQWALPRESHVGCPCIVHEGLFVAIDTRLDRDADPPSSPLVPQALLGIDLDTGAHRWTLPIAAVPDGLAAGSDQVYVLSDGTLTAYTDT
ncbi:hypothetical protein SAMN04488554_0130 [Ruania alba]|uniref:PQQ-like domain-containing protein n=2 Tax=Ruania alba TaxID=648782 RepID=A0A1H5BK48_9MICO|nr:hypothetical protein SAMN04488554_0130 [Ruania alba]